MNSYDWYIANRKQAIEDNSEFIAEANTDETPQHILWLKTCYSELKSPQHHATTDRINDRLYFTEPLVNRLMHLAYLAGTKAINDKSHRAGWEDHEAWMHRQLGA